jgi:hypothetical protein
MKDAWFFFLVLILLIVCGFKFREEWNQQENETCLNQALYLMQFTTYAYALEHEGFGKLTTEEKMSVLLRKIFEEYPEIRDNFEDRAVNEEVGSFCYEVIQFLDKDEGQ